MKTTDEMINNLPTLIESQQIELQEAFNALDKLESVSGRKEKETIFKDYMSNETFKQIFWWSQNPYLRYNIKKVKNLKDSHSIHCGSFQQFAYLLKDLAERKVTGDEANELVANFLNSCDMDSQKWFGRVLRHNLKVGLTPKTINSIIPNYIPVFQVMLAKEDKKVKTKPVNVILERKYDGYRSLTRVEHGKVTLFSRQGKPYVGFHQIENEMSHFPDGCYDGEVISLDNQFSGMQKEALRKDTEKTGILNIFDYLTLEEFDNQKCKLTVLDRKNRLLKLFIQAYKGISDNVNPTIAFEYVRYVDNTAVISYSSHDQIEKLYARFLDEGFEGAMMKDIEGLYTFNRSSSWLKIVPFISVDVPIIGFSKGNPHTKYENTLGALKVNYFGNEVLVAGIPDDLRDEIWSHQSYYLGKMIEVHARQESENQQGGKSLRFPRFHQFRPDKDKE